MAKPPISAYQTHCILLLIAACASIPILKTVAAGPAATAAAAVPSSSSSSFCRTDCGDGMRVEYPFGIDLGCGNPNFQGILTCATEGTLNLTTPSGPFQVKSLNLNNHTVILSIGSSNQGQDCYSFLSSANFSLPTNGPLSVINTTFLLINCPQNSSILASSQHFCNFTDPGLYQDFIECRPGYSGPLLSFQTCCVQQSNYPMLQEVIIDPTPLSCPSLMFTSMYNLNESSHDAFYWDYGIQLQWQDPGELESTLCNGCQASNGTCGYNVSSVSSTFVCICAQGNTSSNCNSFSPTPQGSKSQKVPKALVLGITLPAALIISSCFVIWWYNKTAVRKNAHYEKTDDESAVVDPLSDGIVQRFSYRQLVAATSNFKCELGRGGYGVVYKGILPAVSGDQEVAIKVLEGSQQAEQTFQAEVATLGSINHVNLVKLYGYCSEGPRRLLVYEYMCNLSLNRYIFVDEVNKQGSILDWEKRCSIALGAARAIEYLHEGCRQHIIHCDIKPENILLDADFRAKVADFGLAKLMDRAESHFETSRVRGTYGYMAPEWLQGGAAITKKSDVYSFGMMLLEVLSGCRNAGFPDWLGQKVQQNDDRHVLELIDEWLKLGDKIEKADEGQVRRLVQVALWCIQEHPSERPTMNHVVKMMEGTLQIPSISSF